MPKQTFLNLPDEKRQRIIECALDEFAERGYEKSSINRIVKEAGIAKGSFYQYFEDKFDLYEHIITVTISNPKMASFQIAQHDVQLESIPFFTLIRAMFRRNLDAIGQDPRVMKIGVDLAANHHNEVYKRIMGSYADLYNSFYHTFIEAKKRTGEIRPEVDSWVLNYMLLGLTEYIMGLVSNRGVELFATDYPDQLVDALETILSGGIFTDTEPKNPTQSL